MTGRILDSVIYVYPDVEKEHKGTKFFPAYPADVNTISNARMWATRQAKIIKEISHDNSPVAVQIMWLEERGQGGRSYRSIVRINDTNLVVDFREDQLMETIHNDVIKQGLTSESFVWARVGSQTKLVRVGGALYNGCTPAGTKREKIKTFVVGNYYKNSYGSFAYLGKSNGKHIITKSAYNNQISVDNKRELWLYAQKSLVAYEDLGPITRTYQTIYNTINFSSKQIDVTLDYKDVAEFMFNQQESQVKYKVK